MSELRIQKIQTKLLELVAQLGKYKNKCEKLEADNQFLRDRLQTRQEYKPLLDIARV